MSRSARDTALTIITVIIWVSIVAVVLDNAGDWKAVDQFVSVMGIFVVSILLGVCVYTSRASEKGAEEWR